MISRPPLARFRIIAQVMQDGKPHSARELAFLLECSAKTITRDIDFMRDRLSIPIGLKQQEEGYKSFTYALMEPVTLCPICSGAMPCQS